MRRKDQTKLGLSKAAIHEIALEKRRLKLRDKNPLGRPRGRIRRLSEAAIEEAGKSGELPLDYMLRIMRNKSCRAERRDMFAIAAAPYLHARVTRVQHENGTGGQPLFSALVIEFGGPDDERIELPVIEEPSKHNVVALPTRGEP